MCKTDIIVVTFFQDSLSYANSLLKWQILMYRYCRFAHVFVFDVVSTKCNDEPIFKVYLLLAVICIMCVTCTPEVIFVASYG